MKLTRFVNIRPIFVVAIETIAAIIGSIILILGKPYLYGFVLGFFAIWSVAFVVWYRRINLYTVLFAIGLALTLIFPIQLNATLNNWHTFDELEGVAVTGVTSDTVYTKKSHTYVWLEKVSLNGTEVKGKLALTITGSEELSNLRAGIRLEFTGNIKHLGGIADGEIDASSHKNNLRYRATASASEITYYQDTPTFFSGLRQRIKDTLHNNLSAETAELSYAMLVGDVTNLAPEISASFRGSGITHILSVSGLHVAFLVFALYYAFKLLGLDNRRGIKLAVTTAVLLIYIFLCGFSPTVIRSSLMTITYLVTRFLFQRYDMLNSISLTAIVVLLISPLMLFDIGFQLSFMAVFGMAAIKRWIDMLLQRVKVLGKFKKTCSAISMTVAAQLATIPLTMAYFQTLSIYSVLSNLVIVPLSELGYIGQMITTPLAMIIPQLGFCVKITAIPYTIMTWLSDRVAEFPSAMIVTMWIEAWFLVLMYLMLLLSSRYIILRRKHKFRVTNILLICMVLALSVYNIPNNPKKMTATMSVIGHSQNILFTTQSGTVLVTDLMYQKDTIQFFSKNRLNKVDYIYLTKSTDLVTLKELCKILKVEKVYAPLDISHDLSIFAYDKVEPIEFVNEREIGGVTFTSYVVNNNYLGIRVQGESSFFIPKSDATYLQSTFATYFPECLEGDVLIGRSQSAYKYTYYVYKYYVDLVTNVSEDRINDCYFFAL